MAEAPWDCEREPPLGIDEERRGFMIRPGNKSTVVFPAQGKRTAPRGDIECSIIGDGELRSQRGRAAKNQPCSLGDNCFADKQRRRRQKPHESEQGKIFWLFHGDIFNSSTCGVIDRKRMVLFHFQHQIPTLGEIAFKRARDWARFISACAEVIGELSEIIKFPDGFRFESKHKLPQTPPR